MMKQSLQAGILPTEVSEPDYLLKIILVGDSGVGKTNILGQFVRNEFNPESKTTIGVEFATRTVQIDDKIVKAQIWDTAGQERYHAVTSAYYKGASGAMLVYDITNSISFNSVRKWLKGIHDNADRKVCIMLIGNKCDLNNLRSITTEESRNLAQNENLLFLETSALSAENIQEAFSVLISTIIEQTISTSVGTSKNGSQKPTVTKGGVKISRSNDDTKCCKT